MEPARLFPVIVLLSLVTVEYGGWALLGFRTGHGTLGAFRERFFAAGHAHAGVLLVLSLACFGYLVRAGYSAGVQWLAGALLLAGVLAQSGGPGAESARGRHQATGYSAGVTIDARRLHPAVNT